MAAKIKFNPRQLMEKAIEVMKQSINEPRTDKMLSGEMQWAMQQMFRQDDTIADLLVPEQIVPEVESQPEPAAKPVRPKHPMLNLGE